MNSTQIIEQQISMMTKPSQREARKALAYINAGHVDIAARTLSALVRCQLTTKQQNIVRMFAMGWPAVALHNDFIA